MGLNQSDKFDSDSIKNVFERVGQICKEQDVILEIAVHGGSALMLNSLFEKTNTSRRITEDIDYILLSGDEKLEAILHQASQECGLGSHVFRDDIKDMISKDSLENELYKDYSGHFRVFVAPMEYILSMKAAMLRSALTHSDVEDVWNIMKILDITDIKQIEEVFEKYAHLIPEGEFPLHKKMLVMDLIDEMNQGGEYSPMLAW